MQFKEKVVQKKGEGYCKKIKIPLKKGVDFSLMQLYGCTGPLDRAGPVCSDFFMEKKMNVNDPEDPVTYTANSNYLANPTYSPIIKTTSAAEPERLLYGRAVKDKSIINNNLLRYQIEELEDKYDTLLELVKTLIQDKVGNIFFLSEEYGWFVEFQNEQLGPIGSSVAAYKLAKIVNGKVIFKMPS